MSRLYDIVANLAEFDEGLTIYAARPWTAASDAVVAEDPEEGGGGETYFMGVAAARQVLEGWADNLDRSPSIADSTDQLIAYASNAA